MSILTAFDPESEEIIKASDVVSKIDNFPNVTLAVFNRKFIKILLAQFDAKELTEDETGCKFPIYLFEHHGTPLAICCVALGGPGAAGDLEELLALGAQKVLFFGSAGALDSTMTAGHVIVPTAAYRDEGTSYHYMPSSDFIEVPTAAKLADILKQLDVPYHTAKTWTTDAFYRETRNNLEQRKADGCAVVEQECASVMAVGQFRRKEIYQFLYAADCLAGTSWDARILGNSPTGLREQILTIALEIAIRL